MYSTKEKQIFVSLVTSMLIFGLYSLYVYHNYIAGHPEVLNDFKFWGKAFLIFIPVAIVVQIIIHIIFAIINKIVTNEDVSTMSDEMDKFIELKALRISHWIFTLGFFLAMGSQAIEMPPFMMFIILICSGLVSSVVEGIAQIYFYRKGV